ncbi:MAG: hypothetical protein IIT48_09950 [Lachnospiraceae bacterium]|nr:hypothetical protein [Lachnospiraceae bacterium]
MKTNLTEIFDNISYESAEEIAKKYEASAHTVDENFETRIYNRVMVMIGKSDSKSGTNS